MKTMYEKPEVSITSFDLYEKIMTDDDPVIDDSWGEL